MVRLKVSLITLLKRILRNKIWPVAVIVFALTACVRAISADPHMEVSFLEGEDSCGAAEFAQKIKAQPLSLEALQEMQRDRNIRVIEPDAAVTLDYNPKRLNVHINDFGRVSHLTCG